MNHYTAAGKCFTPTMQSAFVQTHTTKALFSQTVLANLQPPFNADQDGGIISHSFPLLGLSAGGHLSAGPFKISLVAN